MDVIFVGLLLIAYREVILEHCFASAMCWKGSFGMEPGTLDAILVNTSLVVNEALGVVDSLVFVAIDSVEAFVSFPT